jgi:hypothetical protein
VTAPEPAGTFDTVRVGLRSSTVLPPVGLTMPGAAVMEVGAAGESSPQLRARAVATASVAVKTRAWIRGISKLFLSG